MRTRSFVGLLLAVLSANPSTRAQSISVENFGITARGPVLIDDWLAFAVAESGEGRDLNGDGDSSDEVLHLARTSTGSVSNLRIATVSFSIQVAGKFVVFDTYEASQGHTDINGDGDSEDAIQTFLDTETGRLTFIPLPAYGLTVEDGVAVFGIRELDSGGDLNGDGDSLDLVLHSLEFDSMQAKNHRLALTGTDLLPLLFHAGLVAAPIGESDHGGVDLNGDGDGADIVLVLVRPLTGAVRNLRLAARTASFVGENEVVFGVPEAAQGGEDRNGDGDAGDLVAHVHHVASGVTANIGIAGWVKGGGRSNAAVLVRENEEGETDLNGDGDALDWVLHGYDVARGNLVNSGLGMANESFQFRDRIAAPVWEQIQQADLNGDGDLTDQVLHVFDPRSGAVRNLGIVRDLPPPFTFRNILPVIVSESKQGADLNFDGDMVDGVLHVYDTVLDRLTNLGLALSSDDGFSNTWRLDGTLVTFGVLERAQGDTDLNGDGDTDDFVLYLYDAFRDTTVNTGLAGGSSPNRNRVPARRSEGGTVDLNGDGDMEDSILQLVTYHAPPALRLKVNGLHPDSDTVSTSGPVEFALDMDSGSSVTPLDWYLAVVVSSRVYWLTPTGLLTTPAPLLSNLPPGDFEDLTLASLSLPAGAEVTFAFLLMSGGNVVAHDSVTAAVVP